MKRSGSLSRRTRIKVRVKNWKKELDILCKRVVFARDQYCQWCRKPGTPSDHWAHIRSRRYLSTRWFVVNSVRLCAGCHLRWHHQPLAAAEWFETAFPETAKILRFIDHAGATGKKFDREATRLFLEQELRKYGEGA